MIERRKLALGRPECDRAGPVLVADDLEGEVERLVALGAAPKAHVGRGGARWTPRGDPEGDEFDVVAESA